MRRVLSVLLAALLFAVQAHAGPMTTMGAGHAAAGGGGGGASLNWRYTTALNASGNSLTTTSNGNSFISGKVIALIVWVGAANGGTDCPPSPTFTKKGPYTSSYYGASFVLCLRVSDGTETGAFVVPWPTSIGTSSAGYMLELWNASNFDSAGSGGAPTVGAPDSHVSTVAAAGTRFTSAAGETLVSYFASDDDFRNLLTLPVNGGVISYYPGCGSGSPFNVLWGVQIETGLATGADVYRDSAFQGSGGGTCTAATDGGVGFSVALVP